MISKHCLPTIDLFQEVASSAVNLDLFECYCTWIHVSKQKLVRKKQCSISCYQWIFHSSRLLNIGVIIVDGVVCHHNLTRDIVLYSRKRDFVCDVPLFSCNSNSWLLVNIRVIVVGDCLSSAMSNSRYCLIQSSIVENEAVYEIGRSRLILEHFE